MTKTFEVYFGKENGYNEKFNAAMRYMLEQLPECEIQNEDSGYLTITTTSEEAANLIEWLSKTDCLLVWEAEEE